MTPKNAKFRFLLLVGVLHSIVYLANAQSQTSKLKSHLYENDAPGNFWKSRRANDTSLFKVMSADTSNNRSETLGILPEMFHFDPTPSNAVPEIVISGDPSVVINMSESSSATGTFNIKNMAQDELDFKISALYTGRTTPTSLPLYPGVNKNSIRDSTKTAGAFEDQPIHTSFQKSNTLQGFFNKPVDSIIYDDGNDSADSYVSPPSPMEWKAASAFEVPDSFTGKFTLTHVSSYIKASESSGETTLISIVKGGITLSEGELILSQEAQNVDGEGFVTVPLETHFSFEAGDKFWVVYTYAAVPIDLGYDENISLEERPGAYLLNAYGTWDDLQESGIEVPVLNIRAIESSVEGLTFDMESGMVPPGISKNITLTYDASGTTQNGSYNFNLFVSSNDSACPVEKMECAATVIGHPLPSIAISPDTIYTEIDASEHTVKVETLTLYNNGLEDMTFDIANPIIETDNRTSTAAIENMWSPNNFNRNTLSALPRGASLAYGILGDSLVTFSTNNPGSYLSSIYTGYTPILVGDFGANDNQHMYVISMYDELLKLNVESGNTEFINYAYTFDDLACDRSSGTMYLAGQTGWGSSLGTIDLETAHAPVIGETCSGIIASIACDGDGNLWGVNYLDDYLYAIDKETGAGTPVGPIGFNSGYHQSMAWDPKSDKVYLSVSNSTAGEGQLRLVDTQTGATERVGTFPDGATVCALAFPDVAPDFLTASPLSGTLPGMSSVDLNLEVDATNLPNGSYSNLVTIYSNDADNPSIKVPVYLTVSGQVGDIETNSEFLAFGAVFTNGKKTMPLPIHNKGAGKLAVSEITSDLSLFETDFEGPVVLKREDSIIVNVTFNALSQGQFNSVLTLVSDDPNKDSLEITVTATAVSPPVISVAPTDIEVTLNTGEATTQTVSIHNSGLYPLQYALPDLEETRIGSVPNIEKNNTDFISNFPVLTSKEDTDTRSGNPVLLGSGGSDSLDYVWIDSKEEGGPAYSWTDISETGTEILEDIDDGSITLDLPFTFKFYNMDKASVTISSNGYLTFGATGSDVSNDPIPSNGEPNGIIAPYWDNLKPYFKIGQVFYQASTEKFVVQYHEVGNFPYDYYGGSTTFQVILYPDSNIEFVYKDYSLKNDSSATIGIENDHGNKGLQVAFNTAYIEPEMSILIQPGAAHFYIQASPLSGIVQPNSAQEVELYLDATGLDEGTYYNELTISSNDPLHPVKTVTTTLNVLENSESSTVSETLSLQGLYDMEGKRTTLSKEDLDNPNGMDRSTGSENFKITLNSLMNFPNPAKNATTFVYELVVQGQVKLELFTSTGSYVDLIVDEKQTAGEHRVEYMLENLPSGVYFYRLVINGNPIGQRPLTIQ